eukprot:m.902233 g.902233  ORF g.902233 m.902233 type:complete len:326 (-) comp23689_c3_seq42:577-1554(-)
MSVLCVCDACACVVGMTFTVWPGVRPQHVTGRKTAADDSGAGLCTDGACDCPRGHPRRFARAGYTEPYPPTVAPHHFPGGLFHPVHPPALQRDIMRKFKADRINEKDFDDRWRTFVGHASASWKLTSQDPFGTALSDALRGQIDMMQPRAVFERLTTHQLDAVATALGIAPHHVSWPRLKRWVPMIPATVSRMLQIICGWSPTIAYTLKHRKFIKRVSHIRRSDRALAESPGEIGSLDAHALWEHCCERGIQIEADGQCHRAHSAVHTTELTPSLQMQSWLTRWVALSTIRGYDPVFLCLWSLNLEKDTNRTHKHRLPAATAGKR